MSRTEILALQVLVDQFTTIDRKTATFTRYPIAYNSTAGAGMQFVVLDFDKDGDKDFFTAGKTGQYWFENLCKSAISNYSPQLMR